MTLTEFETAGKEPWQVTQAEWIRIQIEERRRLKQPEIGDNPNAPYIEFKMYHEDEVRRAMNTGKQVPQEVVADYVTV